DDATSQHRDSPGRAGLLSP
ncbi:MAG: hypothetical protein AVDCRST_MAG87-1384, partial [uncultured Thermomicrobiales bacterium]